GECTHLRVRGPDCSHGAPPLQSSRGATRGASRQRRRYPPAAALDTCSPKRAPPRESAETCLRAAAERWPHRRHQQYVPAKFRKLVAFVPR
ncbi:unnamed protein product, partial [Ixodes pacificus]